MSNPIVTTRKGNASDKPITSTGMSRKLAIGRPMMNAKIEEMRMVEAMCKLYAGVKGKVQGRIAF